MTAGGNKNIVCAVGKHFFIFFFHYCCADRRFLDIKKSEFFYGVSHCFDSDALIVCDK